MVARKPTVLKIAQGTYRPDRAAVDESTPLKLTTNDKPPKWLKGPYALRGWRELIPTLGEIEVTTVGDWHSIAIMCDAFGRFLALRDIVEREGFIHTTSNENTGVEMIRAHPAVAMLDAAFNQTVRLFIEFGMTPASRTKIEKVKEPASEDPFAAWAGQTG